MIGNMEEQIAYYSMRAEKNKAISNAYATAANFLDSGGRTIEALLAAINTLWEEWPPDSIFNGCVLEFSNGDIKEALGLCASLGSVVNRLRDHSNYESRQQVVDDLRKRANRFNELAELALARRELIDNKLKTKGNE